MFITSYNEEFQWPKQTRGTYKKKAREDNADSERIKRSDPIYRNSETLKELTRECLLPFDYLLRDKPIIKTDPKHPYPVQLLPEESNNTALLTRPRVFKAPEISLDDINDPDVRKTIIDYTYSTTYDLATKDIGFNAAKREEPINTLEEPDHIRFRKNQDDTKIMCEIEEGMVKDKTLNTWEREQSRFVGDPTTTFWTSFRNNTRPKLIDQETIEIKSPDFTKNIINLARDDKLRLPYCLKPSDYTGYMPRCPIGIAPEKQELGVSDTMQTAYTLSNRWRGHSYD